MKVKKKNVRRLNYFYVDYRDRYLSYNEILSLPECSLKKPTLMSRISRAEESGCFRDWKHLISTDKLKNSSLIKESKVYPVDEFIKVMKLWPVGSLSKTTRYS